MKGNRNDVPISKIVLLLPISRLYLIPDFIMEEATSDPVLVRIFYDVAIKLTEELPIKCHFRYYADNFSAYDVRNVGQLIEFFKFNKENVNRDDSRYRMGFRSIWVILDDNLANIDEFYICEINKLLQPFFMLYAHKELLIPGCEFIN